MINLVWEQQKTKISWISNIGDYQTNKKKMKPEEVRNSMIYQKEKFSWLIKESEVEKYKKNNILNNIKKNSDIWGCDYITLKNFL